MTDNEQLITNFYSAFQKLDAVGMNINYSDDIVFFDPVFGLLQGDNAKAMWQMLCKNAKDFSLTYSNIIHLDNEYSTCEWIATYTFSKTGKTIINKGKANMRFAQGKIIEHSDGFSLHKWSKQAFGILGILFGWSTFFQNRIRKQAQKNLRNFIERNNE